ncbi:30S ribosomal protein S9, partial [bacterium]|nr:30S ribosomal protein S9 [bacterium]
GGGYMSQAGAVRLGIARALVKFDETLKPELKKHGFISVDSRVKERKKYGQKGARRKFQFTKR